MFVRWLFYGCGVLNISININRKRCAIARKHNMNPNEQQVQKIDATHTRKKIIFIFSFTEYKNITIARYSRFFLVILCAFLQLQRFNSCSHDIFMVDSKHDVFAVALFVCAKPVSKWKITIRMLFYDCCLLSTFFSSFPVFSKILRPDFISLIFCFFSFWVYLDEKRANKTLLNSFKCFGYCYTKMKIDQFPMALFSHCPSLL